MGTITITSAGFTAPRPNGSRAGTITDADYDRFIAWARARTFTPTTVAPTDTRTPGQVLADFVAAEWNAWMDAVQVYERPTPTTATRINITG